MTFVALKPKFKVLSGKGLEINDLDCFMIVVRPKDKRHLQRISDFLIDHQIRGTVDGSQVYAKVVITDIPPQKRDQILRELNQAKAGVPQSFKAYRKRAVRPENRDSIASRGRSPHENRVQHKPNLYKSDWPQLLKTKQAEPISVSHERKGLQIFEDLGQQPIKIDLSNEERFNQGIAQYSFDFGARGSGALLILDDQHQSHNSQEQAQLNQMLSLRRGIDNILSIKSQTQEQQKQQSPDDQMFRQVERADQIQALITFLKEKQQALSIASDTTTQHKLIEEIREIEDQLQRLIRDQQLQIMQTANSMGDWQGQRPESSLRQIQQIQSEQGGSGTKNQVQSLELQPEVQDYTSREPKSEQPSERQFSRKGQSQGSLKKKRKMPKISADKIFRQKDLQLNFRNQDQTSLHYASPGRTINVPVQNRAHPGQASKVIDMHITSPKLTHSQSEPKAACSHQKEQQSKLSQKLNELLENSSLSSQFDQISQLSSSSSGKPVQRPTRAQVINGQIANLLLNINANKRQTSVADSAPLRIRLKKQLVKLLGQDNLQEQADQQTLTVPLNIGYQSQLSLIAQLLNRPPSLESIQSDTNQGPKDHQLRTDVRQLAQFLQDSRQRSQQRARGRVRPQTTETGDHAIRRLQRLKRQARGLFRLFRDKR